MKVRLYINLIVLLLCLCGTISAQSPVMEKKVSLRYRNVTIAEVLKDLNKRYQINFSYSNNVVPATRRVTVNMKNVMLKDALTDLFRETNIGFQQVGDQIVLKGGIRKNTPLKKSTAIAPQTVQPPVVLYEPQMNYDELLASSTEEIFVDSMPEEVQLEMPVLIDEPEEIPTRRELRKKYRDERKVLRYKFRLMKDSVGGKKGNRTLSRLELKYNYITQKLKQEFNQVKDTIRANEPKLFPPFKATPDSSGITRDSIVATQDSSSIQQKDTVQYEHRIFQATFVSPLGTNGTECGRIVNVFSFNAIGGYAAGLEGIEMGGVANVEKEYVKGIQFGGVANVAGTYVRGLQAAGVANVVGDDVYGMQFAGTANVCGDSVKALQSAGFCNIVNGSFTGLQSAGFCNVVNGRVDGLQSAGFCNISKDSVKGIQVSGFLNTAGTVKGMQIGFINICDTIKGVPLGFLSIVRKGYRRLDIYGSESLYGNIAFKTGTQHFHNIFHLGAQVNGSDFRWAFGYGVGSEYSISKRLLAGIELTSMHISENDVFTPKLNLLNKAVATFGVRVGKRTAIYAGPTLNVMVSQYKDPDKYEIGSGLAPYTLFNKTYGSNSNGDTNLKIWFGINAGIRF